MTLLYQCPQNDFEIHLIGDAALGAQGMLQVLWVRGSGKAEYPYLLTLEKDLLPTEGPQVLDILKECTLFACQVLPRESTEAPPKVLTMRVMLIEREGSCVRFWVEPGDKARLMPVLFGGN